MSHSKINNSLSEKAALEAQEATIDAYLSKKRKLVNAMMELGIEKDDERIQAVLNETVEYLKRV